MSPRTSEEWLAPDQCRLTVHCSPTTRVTVMLKHEPGPVMDAMKAQMTAVIMKEHAAGRFELEGGE